MRKIVSNKRGDVPITLLVVGVFALCSLALFTFIVSDIRTSNSFVGVSKLSELNFKIDQYKFLKNQGVSEEKILASLGYSEIDGENYFVLDRKKTFSIFSKSENDLEFYVKYKIPD